VPEAINNIGMTFARQGNDKLALEYYFQIIESCPEKTTTGGRRRWHFSISDIPLFLKRNMEKPKNIYCSHSLWLRKQVK